MPSSNWFIQIFGRLLPNKTKSPALKEATAIVRETSNGKETKVYSPLRPPKCYFLSKMIPDSIAVLKNRFIFGA